MAPGFEMLEVGFSAILARMSWPDDIPHPDNQNYEVVEVIVEGSVDIQVEVADNYISDQESVGTVPEFSSNGEGRPT